MIGAPSAVGRHRDHVDRSGVRGGQCPQERAEIAGIEPGIGPQSLHGLVKHSQSGQWLGQTPVEGLVGEDPEEDLLASDAAEIALLDLLPLPARDGRQLEMP